MATNIPISQIVNANVSIQNAAVEEQNFNNLLLVTTQNTTPAIIPKSERVRKYASSDAVISDFGTASEATKAAEIWFGQDPKPEELLIALRYGTGGPAPDFNSSVLGRTVSFPSSLTQWQSITDGGLKFTYNNVVFTLSNMDFTSVLLPNDVVIIVQAILNDIQSSNIQISLTDTAGNPIDDALWTSIVAISGELTFNYNPTVDDTNFYLASSSTTKNFTNIGTPSFGSDISVNALTNLDAGYIAQSPVASGYKSNDLDEVIDFSDFSAINDGSFAMTINGNAADYTGVDFTNCANNPDVAAVIAQKLTNQLGYDVTVGLLTGNTLVIQSTTTDMTVSSVGVASTGTDVSIFLGASTTTAEGTYLETPPEAIFAATELNNDWYGVALTKEGITPTEVSFANIQLTAAYIQSQTKQYYARLEDLDIASSSGTDDGSTLANFNYTRTVPCFHEDDEYLDVGAAGNLLTTVAGSATLMFKTAEGVSASDVNVNGQAFVLAKNVNIQSLIGGVSIIRNGTVSSTQVQFADVIRFVDWLTNEIEVEVYSVLVANDIVPYTDTGVNQLISGVKSALDQGVANGGIATVIDDDGNVVASYTISAPRVATVPVSQRANRVSPDIAFSATLGNAIQKVTVNGVVSF
jgi:hypothetical protein